MSLPEAHLAAPGPVTRAMREAGWPYSLNEAAMPRRAVVPDAAAVTRIGDWLDVENVGANRRWAPARNTYCNIYAHDYCALAGAYLPRIWWLPPALRELRAGRPVAPVYGKTVGEMNANALFDWLVKFGPEFGWSRLPDATAAQAAANGGGVVVWSGAKKDAALSGHITVVVPETAERTARRHAATGAVEIPLQSQAGRSNLRYHTRDLFAGSSWRGHALCGHN